jgi:hypothetical protein
MGEAGFTGKECGTGDGIFPPPLPARGQPRRPLRQKAADTRTYMAMTITMTEPIV